MTEPGVVRNATNQDIDRIADLWAEQLDFHAGIDPRFERRPGSRDGFADHLRGRLGQGDFILLVAEVEGEVIGFLNGELSNYSPCFVSRAHGFIDNLAVSPRWQRNGHGTALLKKSMSWFTERGVPAVELRVLMANPLAMGFWEKAGFQPYIQTFRTPTNPPEE
jgi:ribosomal protein S18 acetylase RimI-like enzyme